jgi:hypothetical protein
MSYPNGPYTPPSYVGGNDGAPFGFCAKLDATIQTVIIWKGSGGHSLTGIKVTYTDGGTDNIGPCNGDSTTWHFKTGEKCTDATQWGNGYGTATGRIQFHTDANQTLDWGQNTNGQTAYPVSPVGSGLIVGFAGNADSDWIRCLSPVFLADMTRVYIDNVNYTEDPSASGSGVQLQTLQQETFAFNDEPYTYTFNGTHVVTTTSTFTYGGSIEVSGALEFSAGLFGFGSKFTAGLKVGASVSQANTQTDTTTLSWTSSNMIKSAADAVECTAECYVANIDVPFTANFNVVTADGQVHTSPTTGKLSQVAYSKVNTTVKKLSDVDRNAGVGGSSAPATAAPGAQNLLATPAQDAAATAEGDDTDANAGDEADQADDDGADADEEADGEEDADEEAAPEAEEGQDQARLKYAISRIDTVLIQNRYRIVVLILVLIRPSLQGPPVSKITPTNSQRTYLESHSFSNA